MALDEQCWGRYDPDRNDIVRHECAVKGSEDLLNLAAVETLAHGGTVYALDSDLLPEPASSAAALYAFEPEKGSLNQNKIQSGSFFWPLQELKSSMLRSCC